MARATVVPARMSFEDCAARAAAAERRIKRAMKADAKIAKRSYAGPYTGARMSRLEYDWIASCIAADQEVKRDAYRLRSRARELARNNRLAKQYLRLVVLNVIGPSGFGHQAQVRDAGPQKKLNKRLNDKIETGWATWSAAATLDRQHSRVQLENQLIRAACCDGEVFVRLWRGMEFNDFGLALEPWDADQIDHEMNLEPDGGRNAVRMGVEVDAYGRRVAYHGWDEPMSYARQRNRVRVPASQMMHLYDPDRVNQTRGVTEFHPVMLPLHFLEEYAEAELVACRIGASKPIIWQRRKDGIAGVEEKPGGEPLQEIEPGIMGFAPDGYEAATLSLDHPSTAFESFMRDQKREIAAGLGVGYAALTADLSDTSFSSARTGTQLERDTWRGKQTWWLNAFLLPVYREWMSQALLVGAATGGVNGLSLDARDPRRFLDVTFAPRGWDYVNPLQGMNAAVLAVTHGLASRTRLIAEGGDNVEDVFDDLQREAEMAAERNIKITDEAAAAGGAEAQKQAEVDAAIAAADAAKKSLANGHANGHTNRIREHMEVTR